MSMATPQRRTMGDLAEIFSSLPTSYSTPDGAPAAPMHQLPALLESFEAKRGIQLLSPDEMAQFSELCTPDNVTLVGLDTLMAILSALNPASPAPPLPKLARQVHNLDDPTLFVEDTSTTPPSTDLTSSTSSLNTSDAESSSMLKPDPSLLSDGSPIPRRARSRTAESSSSNTSEPSTPDRKQKRRSIFGFPLSPSSSSNTLEDDEGDLDVSSLVPTGGTYLGVPLEGPLGEGWNAVAEAEKLRVATKGIGTRDKEVIQVLGDKTFPQIRSIDRAYKEKYGKSLLQLIASEGSLRSHLEFTLKGLVMGPLNFDVELLHKCFDGLTKNESLLIELIIARSPASLELLRVAYAHQSHPSSTTIRNHKLLDSAISAAYSGLSNATARKIWEIALEGKWLDMKDNDQRKPKEQTSKLLKEDVDQLRVALRKNGNFELAARILLARSPEHLHSIQVEFLKKGGTPLTRAIKQSTTGTVQSILLHVAETAKKDGERPGVWRDTKLIRKTIEGLGTKNEALSWRIVRAHWDRPRFQQITFDYNAKYHKTLLKDIVDDTSGSHRDLLKALISSTEMPSPTASKADVDRLAGLAPRTRVISTSSRRSDDSVPEATGSVLEASGEMDLPPSPRSPPPLPAEDGDATPPLSSFPQFASRSVSDEGPEEDGMGTPWTPSSSFLPLDKSLSSSSIASDATRGHKSSSSLSSRPRTSPLEFAPRPGSAGGPARPDIRHTRPVAPSRRRQASTDLSSSQTTEDSTSPPLTSRSGNISPGEMEPDLASSTSSSLSSSGAHRRESSGSSISSRRGGGAPSPLALPASPPLAPTPSDTSSPPSSIDTTSYHAPPISPVGDVGPSSSPPGVTSSAYDFGALNSSVIDYFSGSDSSPEKPGPYMFRRENSTTSTISSGESRPGSMFLAEGFGSAGAPFGRPGSMAPGPEQQLQLLFRHNHDLSKKLKESEARHESSASAFEQELYAKEATLAEAKSELQTKRREEKELRSAEKQHLSQITSLEADIAKLTKSLERSRELYENMKRNYQDQCTEAEKLRTMVATTRQESKAAEEAAAQHEVQVRQFERDKELLQARINTLDEELAVALRAQESLVIQKQENLVLKETIDRLRFDLDELRSAGRKSLFLDGTGSTTSLDRPGGSAYEGSMSKSLGRELARQLAEAEANQAVEEEEDSEGGEGEEGSEEEVDLVVTTHRRVKKRGTRTTGPPAAPTITHVEETTVVADAETQTYPTPTTDLNVQTDLTAVSVNLVHAPSIETQTQASIEEPKVQTEREKKEALAQDLGISLERLDEFVRSQEEPKSTTAPTLLARGPESSYLSRRGRWSRISSHLNTAAQAPSYFISVFPDSAKPYVSTIVQNSTSLVLWSLCAFLTGVLSGAVFLPLTRHYHVGSAAPYHVLISSGDRAHWHQLNSFGQAWGEGLGAHGAGRTAIQETFSHWLHDLVWGSVSVVRRVPV